MKKHNTGITSKQEVLTGVVVPEKWDDNFEVISVCLSCQGERDISITNLERFPFLLKKSQQEARVTGTVSRNEMGEYLHIESILFPEELSR